MIMNLPFTYSIYSHYFFFKNLIQTFYFKCQIKFLNNKLQNKFVLGKWTVFLKVRSNIKLNIAPQPTPILPFPMRAKTAI